MKISLHIGINEYEAATYGTGNNLGGCVRDAELMRDIAVREGFVANMMLNSEAKVAAYQDAIAEAAKALYQGDKLLITHSGHGTYADRPDGKRATALCFFDQVFWDYDQVPLWRMFRAGVRIIRVIDSCYSESNFRKYGHNRYGKARSIKIPGLVAPKKTNGSLKNVPASIISLSSSSIRQVSWETDAGGAFTDALKVCMYQDEAITYSYIKEGTTNLLEEWGYPQTPQLETSRAGRYKTLKFLT